ncbi:UV excision repair protein rad23 [Pestalotiopsis sp. IQ-011]
MDERIYSSKYLPIDQSRNTSIWQFLLRIYVDDIPKDKVVWQEHEHPDRNITYGDAPGLFARGAAGLQQVLGLKPQDTILIVGAKNLDWVTLPHSAVWAGIVPAGSNIVASAHELVHHITVTESRVVFCDQSAIAKVKDALAMLPKDFAKPTVVGLGEPGPLPLSFPRDFMAAKNIKPPVDLSAHDNTNFVAGICFSSGTSGKPKAVLLSHRNILAYILGARASIPELVSLREREVFYAPLSHVYGSIMPLFVPAMSGVLLVLLREYTFQKYISACAETKATILRMVPPTAVAMAKDPWVAQQDLTTVHTIMCAGAVLPPEIISRLEKLMPRASIGQGYGMSEATVSILKKTSAKPKAGSVGRLTSNVELRIVDDDLKDVSPGTQGEILVRGPSVFMGYKNNPEATAEAFPFNDAWLRTGDVGRMDKEGFLYLTDRKKDLIKYKGNQVPPAELEDVLLSHPLVTEAGVCAIWDDEQATEVPVAYVTLDPSVTPSDRDRVLAEVRSHHDKRVAPYKKLRGGLFYILSMPRNPTGKLLRRELPARKEADAAARKIQAKL